MAEVHGRQEQARIIKLFGKMIGVQGIKDERKSDNEDLRAQRDNDDDEKIVPEKIIPCPRCKSMETKFCYFNNYNVNQPRHFCKGCQRYWTAGGALRNVPVGAGRRKAKIPCQTAVGLESESCGYESSSQVQFDHHLTNEADWRFRLQLGHRFPAKRRRGNSEGQLC